jgi:alpha-tubulin suppressor-like RCC1 family protein
MEALIANKLRLYESASFVVATEFDEFTLFQNKVNQVPLSTRSEIKFDQQFRFKQIAASNNYFLGLTISGEIIYWGREAYEHPQGQEHPIKVKPFGDNTNFLSVACSSHTCAAIDEHHRLYLFGNNRDNHLGLQSPFEKSYNVPIPVPFDEHLSYLQVALGEDHRVALTTEKDVYIWGKNSRYQLGVSDVCLEYYRPTRLALPGKARKVSCGDNHSAILMENNDLYFLGNTSKIASPVAGEVFNKQFVELRRVASNVVDVACWRYKTAFVTSYQAGNTPDHVYPYELERPKWLTIWDTTVFVGIEDYDAKKHGFENETLSTETKIGGAISALGLFGGNQTVR